MLASAAAAAVLTGGLLAGCQTYDFEPVQPLSIAKEEKEVEVTARGGSKPNVMLLVDRSDSMDRPEDPTLPACTVDGQLCSGEGGTAAPACPSSCPTRWQRLQEALQEFLAPGSDGSFGFRVGLTLFPAGGTGDLCSASASIQVELPTEDTSTVLADAAAQANTRIQSIRMRNPSGSEQVDPDSYTQGGTPTGPSLRYILDNVEQLQGNDRQNFVLLLTDGLPNCNDAHAAWDDTQTPNPCVCSLSGDLCKPPAPGTPAGFDFSRKGCFDPEGSVASIQALRASGISTIVVGFSSETSSGAGPEMLQAMGEAGGYTRSCQSNADCGGETCSNNVCTRSYFQADNGAQLAEALRSISQQLINTNPCEFDMSTVPSEEGLIFVKVDGAQVPRQAQDGSTNWVFDPATSTLEFQGALCSRMEASTQDDPVKVSISILQSH
jgi:hypothetical protein